MELKIAHLDKSHVNRPGTLINKVTGVVVHWTANENTGADALANRNYFNRKFIIRKEMVDGKLKDVPYEADGKKKFTYASAHANVDDKCLVECLPWSKGKAEMGYHVGATSYKAGITNKLGTTYPNNRTIGLEICVNKDGDFKKAYANAIKVTASMLKEHGLGINDLYRHFDITGKMCPGFHVDNSYAKKYLGTTADAAWQAFKAAVGSLLIPKVEQVTPKNYKVYIKGSVYKYQFLTSEGAINCAKALFREAAGKDTTIYVIDPNEMTIYTPHKHPEDFPEYQKKEPDKVTPAPLNLDGVPKWAQVAVRKAFNKGVITDPVGTNDFYRFIVTLDNLKLLD